MLLQSPTSMYLKRFDNGSYIQACSVPSVRLSRYTSLPSPPASSFSSFRTQTFPRDTDTTFPLVRFPLSFSLYRQPIHFPHSSLPPMDYSPAAVCIVSRGLFLQSISVPSLPASSVFRFLFFISPHRSSPHSGRPPVALVRAPCAQ